MTTRLRLLALIAPLLIGSLAAQTGRIPSRIDDSRTVMLGGRVHPRLRAQNDLGPVGSGFRLPGMTLMLKPSAAQRQAVQQLVQEQQDPASPNYHKWLTPEEYGDRFGVGQEDVDKITGWLESQGFTVDRVARSRTWIRFSGTAGQAGRAFHTQIHRYQAGTQTRFGNATDPSIPAALADVVAGVRGLHNVHMRPHYRIPANSEYTSGSGNHQIAPDDFATIYNVAPLYQAGIDGTGQNIAVVGQTDIRMSDINGFRNRFNLSPAQVNTVLVPGRTNPGVVSGDVEEAHLDIEWAGAVARNASITYVFSDDVWESAMYAVDQNVAPVLTMSYGGCEMYDLVDLPSFQDVARQANAQGMTWLAASGDAGATDCEDLDAVVAQNGLAVDVPAAIPEVTAMGGTTLTEGGGMYWNSTNTANSGSAISYIPEVAWNDSNLGFGFASTGGGSSVFFTRPSWQTGPGVPNDGVRHVPDLALASSAHHDGYLMYSGGKSTNVGGTSVAAPTMAGIVALLNQYLVSTSAQPKPGLGNINPTLYRLAVTSAGVFHDVTIGDNTSACAAGTPNCVNGVAGLKTGPGYDDVTGLGSVDAYNLVHSWTGQAARASAVVLSIDANPLFQLSQPDAKGNHWTFKLTLAEEAGVATTLTDLTVNGVSYASQLDSLFGTKALAARGSVSAALGLANMPPSGTLSVLASGVDAGGQPWTTQLSVPVQGPRVALTIAGISNAASGDQSFAPGMIVSVYGTGLGSLAQAAAAIPLPKFLAGFGAWINGVEAPLYYVSPNQVNLQIPYETRSGTATLEVGNPYENVQYRFRVSSSAPGIFTFTDGTINPFPAGSRGQTVTLFITGEGNVTPSLATGDTPSPRTSPSQLPKPQLQTTVTVGGAPAVIQFIGIPSGLVGVTQVNFTIPDGVASGPQPVVVTVGTAASRPATITVQ